MSFEINCRPRTDDPQKSILNASGELNRSSYVIIITVTAFHRIDRL